MNLSNYVCENQMSIADFLNPPSTPKRCYYCKHLNRNKKKVTGLKNNIYIFGCMKLEDGYVPGGAAIGNEYEWLKSMGCGYFERS
jgi:hypothetical protein